MQGLRFQSFSALNCNVFSFILPLVIATAGAVFSVDSVLADPAKSSSGKIIKWTDEKGVTHYGDSLPTQYSGQSNTVINSRGMEVERNKAFTSQSAPAKEKEEQQSLEDQRRDKALLGAFSNEQEIDLARDRNLQIDEVAVEGLTQSKSSAQSRLSDKQKLIDGFNQRKKPVPPNMADDAEQLKNEIARYDDQIAQRQKSMDETRARFESDKKRFLELKAGKP